MSYTSKDIKNIVAEILENKKDKGGVKSLYFCWLWRVSWSFVSCKNIYGERVFKY